MADLVTRAEYKAYRGVAGTTDDARTDVLIPSISALIRTYCGRSFTDNYTSNKTEYFTLKWEQSAIFVSELPIVSVVSVEELVSGSQTEYDTLTTDQYVVDPTMDAIYRVEDGVRLPFSVGINSVRVVYKGGYSTIPGDLRLAVYDLITYYLKDQHIPEKNHASFTVRYNNDSPDFPDHIKRVLDLYKDV